MRRKIGMNWDSYAKVARQVAAEGCVLLKNEEQILPITTKKKIAVFGTNAFHYYKSGLGSGGMVNTEYVVSILDAMLQEENMEIDQELIHVYEDWIRENPFDEGHGWGTTPWSQQEMPITLEMVENARKRNNIAVVMIGRTAGEDQDNDDAEGSYRLREAELAMLELVSKVFDQTIVLLNVGNIIDMSWMELCNPKAVLYVWQGGQEGGNGVVDVLTGRVNACGKLTDTIAYHVEDYPSDAEFGNEEKNRYEEDIYVGYRYFSSVTGAEKKVRYPFGFGLSYTTFSISGKIARYLEDEIIVEAIVTNTGKYAGKEVVQVYVEAPQGKLGKPLRVLVGFAKTNELKPGDSQHLEIRCAKSYFASFDEEGITGNPLCVVLEQGTYKAYLGPDVQKAALIGEWVEKETVLQQCRQACAPVEDLERQVLTQDENGAYVLQKKRLERTVYSPEKEICDFEEIKQKVDQKILLKDVYNKEASLCRFIAQLTDEDLLCLARGEGMCSMKVTPGTAGAFGGLTPHLKQLGIPAICCADGPSGIRMDCGTVAFSLPNGTLTGCTFNLELVEELFDYVGKELCENRIDTILGPGINIHRHPLNGRNFEYFSEDPVLTGKMCVAQLNGLHKNGVTGTIKHYCANNQEHYRTKLEAVISQRALREIYLKCFEIAVKEGNARSVMTTYGPVNGLFTAGSYDLCTIILREEWGFQGIVMTDWWANANWYGQQDEKLNRAPMVIAQNDLFMLCADTLQENEIDNLKPEFEKGRITRAMLQRNAKNILTFILQTPAMDRLVHGVAQSDSKSAGGSQVDVSETACFCFERKKGEVRVNVKEHPEILTKDGAFFGMILDDSFTYDFHVKYQTVSGELAQIPVSVFTDNIYRKTVSVRGTNGVITEKKEELGTFAGPNHYVKLNFKPNEIDIHEIAFITR